ncbi:MAG: ECF-type sigma factor [Planctomycetota bacterium JB042]
MSEVTELFRRLADGDADAPDALLPLVYDELRRVARRQMAGERADHTLSATALVHEAWLKLAPDGSGRTFEGRRHFVAVAARAMRRLLVDHARGRRRERRGGDRLRVTLDAGAELAADEDPEEILALDEALRRLAEKDPRASRVVELRTFAGLSIDETADALGVSPRTVKREWTLARAWLFREMTDRDDERGER